MYACDFLIQIQRDSPFRCPVLELDFEGVGTGDTAGIWEGSPNLRPDFRALHQKKLDKAARAAKAEEMI